MSIPLPERPSTFIDSLTPRQIVADASVVRVEHDMCPKPRLIVEAELLLVEDC